MLQCTVTSIRGYVMKNSNPSTADTPDNGKDTSSVTDTVTSTSETENTVSIQRAQAEMTLKNHMLVALGSGVMPIPVLDVATFLGANINLVRRLCSIYGVPFRGNIVRSAITALASSLGSTGMATFVGASLGKLIPGSGTIAGAVTLPIATTGFTYAVGKLYIGHFEAGGNLFDFSVEGQLSHVKTLYS
ncbi:MAG: YcjF family protein, partial [Flavobacteriales bacterium]